MLRERLTQVWRNGLIGPREVAGAIAIAVLGAEAGGGAGAVVFAAVGGAVFTLAKLGTSRGWWRVAVNPWVATGLVLLVVAPMVATANEQVHDLAFALAVAVALLGLSLLVGVAGQMSFAHVALMGIGAYATAALVYRWHLNDALAVIFGTLFGGLVGGLIGFPALRLRGMFLGVATISIAIVFPSIVKLDEVASVTGGTEGISLYQNQFKPASWAWLTPNRWYYILGALGVVVGGVLFHRLLRSTAGRGLQALRDNETAAATCGVPVTRLKLWVFVLSSMFAAYAGIVYFMISDRYVAPDSYSMSLLLQLLVVLMLGGSGTIAGAIIGGFVLVYLLQKEMSQLVTDVGAGSYTDIVVLVAALCALAALAIGLRLYRRGALERVAQRWRVAAAGTAVVLAAATSVGVGLLCSVLYSHYGQSVRIGPLSDAISGLIVILVVLAMPAGIAGWFAPKVAARAPATPRSGLRLADGPPIRRAIETPERIAHR
jgi:branched-chain amino acid transport system permease protein